MGGLGQYPSDLLERWIAIPAEKERDLKVEDNHV